MKKKTTPLFLLAALASMSAAASGPSGMYGCKKFGDGDKPRSISNDISDGTISGGAGGKMPAMSQDEYYYYIGKNKGLGETAGGKAKIGGAGMLATT